MAVRKAVFSDLSNTLLEPEAHTQLTVTFPEGHRRAGSHRIDAAESEVRSLLGKSAPKLTRVRVTYPEGHKAPRTLMLPANEVEKVLGEALISVDGARTAATPPRAGRMPATVSGPLLLDAMKKQPKGTYMILSEMVTACEGALTKGQVNTALTYLWDKGLLKERQRAGAFAGGSASEYTPK